MAKGKISVVVGGQYGSESKGSYIEKLTRHRICGKIDVAVRTGSPNAGHTVMDNQGRYQAMQQIPVSFIDPNCILVLGAGALISMHVFEKEYNLIQSMYPGRPIYIDENATLMPDDAANAEKEMHARIGSTAEGCGEAMIRKIRRDGTVKQMKDIKNDPSFISGFPHVVICDTVDMLNQLYNAGMHILLEGTQGSGLSLIHGPAPYTTSRDTNAANWLMECGLSPALNVEVHLVFRTFPIRVAGNSGPLPYELTWPQLIRKCGFPVDGPYLEALEDAIETVKKEENVIANDIMNHAMARLPQTVQDKLNKFMEKTTVTKKYRRIAEFCRHDALRAININRPKYIGLTFVNYLDYPNCQTYSSVEHDLLSFSKSGLKYKFNEGTLDLIKFLNQYAKVHYLGISKSQGIHVK